MIPPIARLLTLSVSTVLTAAAIDRLPEAPADRISWQATFGTEQRLELTSHLGIARSGLIPRGGLGMELTAEKPAEIKPVVGKFSGELRWFDFEGKVTKEVLGRAGKAPAGRGGVFKYGPRKDDKVTVNEDVRTSDEPLYMKRKVRGIDTLAYLRKSIAANVDQIWLLPQIQPEIAQQPYGLMDKQGVYFKDQVYECAKLVNSGEFANKSIEVYFEIGNEVNTPDRFSVRDHGPETFNPLNADD